MVSPTQAPSQTQQPAPGTPPPATPSASSSQGGVAGSVAPPFGAQRPQDGLHIAALGPRGGAVSWTEPEIWRSGAGIPDAAFQRLSRGRAIRQRAPASNYGSTGDRRGDLQCDGGGPRRFGPHGAGCGGGHCAWRRGVEAFLRCCTLAGSAAVTAPLNIL